MADIQYKIVDIRDCGLAANDNSYLVKQLEKLYQEELWELVAVDRPFLYLKRRNPAQK